VDTKYAIAVYTWLEYIHQGGINTSINYYTGKMIRWNPGNRDLRTKAFCVNEILATNMVWDFFDPME